MEVARSVGCSGVNPMDVARSRGYSGVTPIEVEDILEQPLRSVIILHYYGIQAPEKVRGSSSTARHNAKLTLIDQSKSFRL
ncbi:hypothetical protein AB4Z22_16655 [Paenibacillus sp. TAF58]